jgi:hypothetical protein
VLEPEGWLANTCCGAPVLLDASVAGWADFRRTTPKPGALASLSSTSAAQAQRSVCQVLQRLQRSRRPLNAKLTVLAVAAPYLRVGSAKRELAVDIPLHPACIELLRLVD